jgi:hypothetical protein
VYVGFCCEFDVLFVSIELLVDVAGVDSDDPEFVRFLLSRETLTQ